MQSTLVTSSIQILKQVILSLEEAKIRPFINVSHTFLHASNFNEKGAGTNNLQYKKSHTHSFRIELATVISHTFAIDATLLQSAVKLG